MKRCLGSILIFIALFMFAFTPSASAVVYGKSGYESHGDFEDDPWEIDSAATLAKFRDDFNDGKIGSGKYIKLINDIDLTSYTNWSPIGYNYDVYNVRSFNCEFDGAGHTITVRMSRSGETYAGIFGDVDGGKIKNLSVTGTIRSTNAESRKNWYVSGHSFLGGIVALLYSGTVENCNFDGTLYMSGKGNVHYINVGGIAGYAGDGKTTIKNCKVGAFSETSITTPDNAWESNTGGIVGHIKAMGGCTFSNNFVRATVEGKNGGIGVIGYVGLVYGQLEYPEKLIADNIEEVEPDTTDPEINISTLTLDDGFVNTAYSMNLISDVDGVTWSWSGNTPNSVGLKLNSSTGLISGTPTKAGTYLFVITAKKDGYISGSAAVSITVLSASEKAVRITTTSLPNGNRNTNYTGRLQANESGVTWSWTGNTPENDGLTLNSSNGAITGTPTVAKSYTFSVIASKSGFREASKTFTIVISGLPEFSITTTTLANAGVGEYYVEFLDAEEAGVTWSWSGNTPESAGLTLDSINGYIEGTPTSGGRYTFTLTASKSGFADASVELTLLIAGGGLAINSTNFPDSNFRSYVSNNIDKDGDGYLSNVEVAAVKTISVENSGISSLKGIEIFTSLEELLCSGNNLTELDISKNTLLKLLHCSKNKLTKLDLSNNKVLESLECDDNQLSALDFTKNTALDYISCSGNKLTTLNVSNNTALKWLYCYDNLLTEIILGNNSVLTALECQNNSGLKSLDIRGCPNLSRDNITYDSGLDIVYNKGDQTPEIEIPTEKPEFTAFSLSLEDRIAVVFYFYLPPDTIDFADEEKCYMKFDIKGGTSNETSKEKWNPEISFTSSKSGKTSYGFKCYINSAQMAESITATLYFNGESFSATSSVKEYLDMALANPAGLGFSEKQIELMYAIMDYGHYAQAMLAKKNEQIKQYIEMPRATDYTDADIAEVKTKAANYAARVITNISRETMSGIGVSLNLDSQTTLNVHYSISSTYKGIVSSTIDGKAVEPVSDGQTNEKISYKVSLLGIASNQLGTTHTINLIADGAMNTVTASGLSYVDLVFLYPDGSYIEGVDIDTMRRAVVALFNYYEAAKAYFPE